MSGGSRPLGSSVRQMRAAALVRGLAEHFDRSLKSRDPSWGLRDLEEVVEKAEKNGLKLVKTVEMPANNLSVIYKKQ